MTFFTKYVKPTLNTLSTSVIISEFWHGVRPMMKTESMSKPPLQVLIVTKFQNKQFCIIYNSLFTERCILHLAVVLLSQYIGLSTLCHVCTIAPKEELCLVASCTVSK